MDKYNVFDYLRFTPVKIEYNCYNGIIIQLLSFDYDGEKSNYKGSFFGLYLSNRFMYIDFLFFSFKIFES